MSHAFIYLSLFVFLLGLPGCVPFLQSPRVSSSKQVIDENPLETFLEFSKNAKFTIKSSRLQPYYEFKLDPNQLDEYNKIYDSIIFDSNAAPSRKEFALNFLIPLVKYKVKSQNEITSGVVEYKVLETAYDHEAYNKELLAPSSEILNSPIYQWSSNNIQDEINQNLAREIIYRFDGNLANARKAGLETDEVTYLLKTVNKKQKIIWKDIRSANAEKRAEEKDYRNEQKREAIKAYLSALQIMNLKVSDYRGKGSSLFIDGIVKNIGDLEVKSPLMVEVQLLDEKGNALSSETGQIAYNGLKPYDIDDFIVSFAPDKAKGWKGAYRLKISDRFFGISKDYGIFHKYVEEMVA